MINSGCYIPKQLFALLHAILWQTLFQLFTAQWKWNLEESGIFWWLAGRGVHTCCLFDCLQVWKAARSNISVLLREKGYTVKDTPSRRDFPRAQTIFHRISQMLCSTSKSLLGAPLTLPEDQRNTFIEQCNYNAELWLINYANLN